MAPRGDNNIVLVPNMKLERVFSMKGGNGEASYANNSQAQVIHDPFSFWDFFLLFFCFSLSLDLSDISMYVNWSLLGGFSGSESTCCRLINLWDYMISKKKYVNVNLDFLILFVCVWIIYELNANPK